MGSDKHSSESQDGVSDDPKGNASPEWADSLRQLYNAVVDEPLPDSFKDLIDKLDSSGSKNRSDDASDTDNVG